ncbi:MAG: phosphatase PAP2 family protein [Deltaproteobacteria bacterium]|nr:phosphatase PAP2 family protein [Deltaproteobacteria bacterium]
MLLFLCATLATAPAAGASPYDHDTAVHASALGAVVLAAGAYRLWIAPDLPGGLSCEPLPGETRCNKNTLNRFDRGVVGNYSPDWLLASDLTLGVMIAGAATGVALDAYAAQTTTPGFDLVTDALVIGEATAAGLLVTHTLKIAIQRPRPTQYTEGTYVGSFEHRVSFPSGHATTAAALAAAYATTFTLRHPDSPWRWAVYASGTLMALATSYARIAGGFHFYSDIVAGLAIGATAGIAVPLLHSREDLEVTPLVTSGGGQLLITWRS